MNVVAANLPAKFCPFSLVQGSVEPLMMKFMQDDPV